MVLVGTAKASPLPPWAPGSPENPNPAYSPTPAPQASPVREQVEKTPVGEEPKVTESQLQTTYQQATTTTGEQVAKMPGYEALPKETKEAWYGYVLEQQMASRGITFPSESARAAAVATQLEPAAPGRATSEPISFKEAQKLVASGEYLAITSPQGEMSIIPASEAPPGASYGMSVMGGALYPGSPAGTITPSAEFTSEAYAPPTYTTSLSISTELRGGIPTGVIGVRGPEGGLLAVGPEGAAYEYAPLGIRYGAERTRAELARSFLDIRYGGVPGALRAAPTVTTAFDFMTGRERELPVEYRYRRPFVDAITGEISRQVGIEPTAAPAPLLTYPYYYTKAGEKKYYKPKVEVEPEPSAPVWARPGGAVQDPAAETARRVSAIMAGGVRTGEFGISPRITRMRAELMRPPEPTAEELGWPTVPEYYFTEISPGVKSYVHKVTTGDIDPGDLSHLAGSMIYGIPIVGEVFFKGAVPAAERIGALGVSIVPATTALVLQVPGAIGAQLATGDVWGTAEYVGGVAFGLGEYMYKAAEEWGRAAGPVAAFSSMFTDIFTILGGTGRAYAQLRGAPAPRAVGIRPKIEVTAVEPIGKNIRVYFKSKRFGEVEYPKHLAAGKRAPGAVPEFPFESIYASSKKGAIWREFRTERQVFVEPAIREMVTAKKGPPTAIVTPEGKVILTDVFGRGKGMSFGVMLKRAPESLKEMSIRKAKAEAPPVEPVGDWYAQLMKSETARLPEKAPALEVRPGGLFRRPRIKPKAEILKETEALEMFERYPEAGFELYEFWGEAMPVAGVRIVEVGRIRPPKPMVEIVGKELPKEAPGAYMEAWEFAKITEPPRYRVGALERLHLRKPTGVPETTIVDRLKALEPEKIGMRIPEEFAGSAEAFIQMTKKPGEPWMPPEKAPIRGGAMLWEPTPEAYRYIARGEMPVAGYRGEATIKEIGEIVKFKGKVRFPEEKVSPPKEPLKVDVVPEKAPPKKMVEFVEPKFKTIEEQLKPTKPTKEGTPEGVVEQVTGKEPGVKTEMIEKVTEKTVERVLTPKEQKMVSEAVMAKVALRPMKIPRAPEPGLMPLMAPMYKEEFKPREVEMTKVEEALLPREGLVVKERLITGRVPAVEQLQKPRQVEMLKEMTEAVPIQLTLLRTEELQITKLREEELQKIREVDWAPDITVVGWVPPPPAPRVGVPLFPMLHKGFPTRKLTKKEKRFKRATKYQPSLIARELKIKGKKPKIVTGLEIRPLR